MTLVQPVNEDNAIKIAAFAFELHPESINQDILETIQEKYHEGFFSSYNNIIPHTEMVVKITESEKQITNNTLGGLSLLQTDAAGNKIWELEINKNAIIATCHKYTRWNPVFDQTKVYLKEIIRATGQDINIRGLTLEYIDEFTVLNNLNNSWKEELFLMETKYLPKHIFELSDPWHSHHGFFISGEKSLNNRILINLNIEYIVSNQNMYRLIIRSQHRSLMENTLLFNSENIDSLINDAMVENHEINKDLLRDLLSESALQAINLGANNA